MSQAADGQQYAHYARILITMNIISKWQLAIVTIVMVCHVTGIASPVIWFGLRYTPEYH